MYEEELAGKNFLLLLRSFAVEAHQAFICPELTWNVSIRTGRQTAAQKREAVSVTMDSIQNLHKSLATCPTERDTEPTPDQLVVELLPHQTRALKWLLWRETQSPAGGILADDMGLGKTLTIISLIVRQRQLIESDPADVWLSKELKIKKSTGTLIVCPASWSIFYFMADWVIFVINYIFFFLP